MKFLTLELKKYLTNNEQQDTTYMLDLEAEQSGEERKKRSKRIKNINSRTNA